MADASVVTPNNLGADFRGVGSKIVNDNIIGGAGAPAGAPAEPSKVWLYVDTTQEKLTHYWSAAAAAWVPFDLSPPPLLVLQRKIPGDHATGSQQGTTTISTRGCAIAQTAVGRYTVTFSEPHPDGSAYEVVYGCEESATTRDVPKVSTVAGSRTANGFQVQVTLDDNGGTADTYTTKQFSFAAKTTIVIVESVSYA